MIMIEVMILLIMRILMLLLFALDITPNLVSLKFLASICGRGSRYIATTIVFLSLSGIKS